MTTFWVKSPAVRTTAKGRPVVVYTQVGTDEEAEALCDQMPGSEILILEAPDEKVVSIHRVDENMEDVMASIESRLKKNHTEDNELVMRITNLWNRCNQEEEENGQTPLWDDLEAELLREPEPALPRLLALASKGAG